MTSRTRGSRTTTATPSRGNTPNPPVAAKSKNKGGPTQEPEWVEPASVHSPNENLKILRSNTEYAVVTQWLAMYCPLISSMSDHSTAKLERDLDNTMPDSYVPQLAAKLLQNLTLDRSINRDHFLPRLRREFARRAPDEIGLLGDEKLEDEEEGGPVPWETVKLLDKIHILHSLCQWYFLDADKFRNLVGEPEDEVEWRITPVGYNAQDDALWLFDDNRLWIQHFPPSVKRRPNKPLFSEPPRKIRGKRALSDLSEEEEILPAKKRKPLPEPKKGKGKAIAPNGRTTRTSKAVDDGWQKVPKEWLEPEATSSKKRGKGPAKKGPTKKKPSTGDESSELSELSESEKEDVEMDEEHEDQEQDEEENEEEEDVNVPLPEGFVEWETLCVTLEDWEEYIEQLATSKHQNEKVFHKYLVKDVLPAIRDDVEEQREAARKAIAKVVAAAVEPTERKRSSRIAKKESEVDAIKQKEAAALRLHSGNRRGADRSRTGSASLAQLSDHERRELRMREREELKLERQNSEILAAVNAAEEDDQDVVIAQEGGQEEQPVEEEEATAEDIIIEQADENVPESKAEDIEVPAPVEAVSIKASSPKKVMSDEKPVESEPVVQQREAEDIPLDKPTEDTPVEEAIVEAEQEVEQEPSEPPEPPESESEEEADDPDEPEYQPSDQSEEEYQPRSKRGRPRKSAPSAPTPNKGPSRPAQAQQGQFQARPQPQQRPVPNQAGYAASPYQMQQGQMGSPYNAPYPGMPAQAQNPEYMRYIQQQHHMQRMAMAQGQPFAQMPGSPSQGNQNAQYMQQMAQPMNPYYGNYPQPHQPMQHGSPAQGQPASAADQQAFLRQWQQQQYQLQMQQQQMQHQNFAFNPQQPQRSPQMQQQYPYTSNSGQQGAIPGLSMLDPSSYAANNQQ